MRSAAVLQPVPNMASMLKRDGLIMCDVDNWFSRFSGTSTDNIDEKLTSYLALVFYYSDTMAGMVKGLRQFHLSYLPFFRCHSFFKVATTLVDHLFIEFTSHHSDVIQYISLLN